MVLYTESPDVKTIFSGEALGECFACRDGEVPIVKGLYMVTQSSQERNDLAKSVSFSLGIYQDLGRFGNFP